jgi:transposase
MHPRAKLTPHGRRLLVARVLEERWPPAEAARAQGVSVATCSKWLSRWQAQGPAGLADRSCRPHRSPRRLPPEREQVILAWRQTYRVGPHRIGWALGEARSTVWAVLARHQMPRLAELDRPSGQPVRYQRHGAIGGSRPAMTTCTWRSMTGPGWPMSRPWLISRARPQLGSPLARWPGSPGWESRWSGC